MKVDSTAKDGDIESEFIFFLNVGLNTANLYLKQPIYITTDSDTTKWFGSGHS